MVRGRRFDTCSASRFLPTIPRPSKGLSRRTEFLAVPGPGARQVHSRFPRAEDRVDELRYVASYAPATAAAVTGGAVLYFDLHRPRLISGGPGVAEWQSVIAILTLLRFSKGAFNLLRIRRLVSSCPVTSVTAEFPATALQLALSQVTLPDLLGSLCR